MGRLHQLYVVMWKNFIIRKRHWILTMFESVLPIVLFLLVSYSRSKIGGIARTEVLETTYAVPNILYDGQLQHNIDISSTQLYYTPVNNLTKGVMRNLQLKLTLNHADVKGFDSELELIKQFQTVKDKTISAIIFTGATPEKFNYDIRMHEPYRMMQTKELFNEIFQYEPNTGSAQYVQSHFLALQVGIDISYIEFLKGGSFNYTISTQEFPYPPHKHDSGLYEIFFPYLPSITIFSFIFLCPALLARITEEKSTGTRELLKMVGLQSWMLWLGWILHSIIPNFIAICIIVFLMKVPIWGGTAPPIEYCSASVYFVFLLLYLLASISFCCAISTFFSRSVFSIVAGVLIWILSYSISEVLIQNYSYLPKCTKLLFGLFPNMAMSFGYAAVGAYETRETSLSWFHLFEPASGGIDDISMGNAFVMLIIDFAFYLLITLYMSTVFPGPYGIPRSWFFPFENIYYYLKYCIPKKPKVENQEEGEQLKNLANKPGIVIKNVTRNFGKHSAVNKLNLEIYQGQITILLGHNGAGKTTTMSMITGMLDCSEGSIVVLDKNLREQKDEVRKFMGLCPQHNLLFSDLTVIEHLILVGMLKGMDGKMSADKGKHLLEQLNLGHKLYEMTSSLSGGMKRKLCLSMALIGGNKVLILDEPTAGMDPESQREVWDLLLEKRKDKTILISTHYMDEAEALADYISIMSHGRLQACGQPLELKDTYKTGYYLTLDLKPNSPEHLDIIEEIVTKIIPSATLKAKRGNVTYVLPIEKKNSFCKLLKELESQPFVNRISLNLTTLEDVFLKSREADVLNFKPPVERDEVEPFPQLADNVNWFMQLLALMRKRWYFFMTRYYLYFLPALMLLLITILTIYLGQPSKYPDGTKGPKMVLDLQAYGHSRVYTSVTDDLSGDGSVLPKLLQSYKGIAASQMGEVIVSNSTSDGIIKTGAENIAYFKKHLIIASEFNNTEGTIILNALFSPFAIHGAPISVNVLMNAIAQTLLGPEHSISTANSPLVKSENDITPQEESEIQTALLWFIVYPLGALFLVGSFISFPNMELDNNFVQLQMMCGVKSYLYWLSNFLFDIIYYTIVVSLVILLTLIVSQLAGWNDFKDVLWMPLFFTFIYGLSAIPFSYYFARFKSAGNGYAVFIIVNLLLGVILAVIMEVLIESGVKYYENVGRTLEYIFLALFPHVGFTVVSERFARKAIQNHNWNTMAPSKRKAVCDFRDGENPCCFGKTPQCKKFQSFLEDEHIGLRGELAMMLIPCLLHLVINIILNTEEFAYVQDIVTNKVLILLHKLKKTRGDTPDSTVLRQVSVTKPESRREKAVDQLTVDGLKKTLGGKEIVRGVSFRAEKGECYGILGVNGAGKTTMFRTLTKELPKTAGTMRITANNKGIIEDNSDDYLKQIGYCPQTNSLNFVLTGRQILEIFARLRGYDTTMAEKVATYFINRLDLNDIQHKPCEMYSGGNKRKICIAISLIGNHPSIFLDEPTNGVDPVSRRQFWEIIKQMQEEHNKTFILTSHSMQECEALCNRLAILKAGVVAEEGTISDLKKQFHVGFSVKLKLKPEISDETNETDLKTSAKSTSKKQLLDLEPGPRGGALRGEDAPDGDYSKLSQDSDEVSSRSAKVEEIKRDLEYEFNGELKDEHSGLLHYHARKEDLKMSDLFEKMENLKNKIDIIEDYIITEATIEDVFLTVARNK